jgi:g-D-glutamyl-meso-diaminopimelate peptidase
MDIFHKIEKFYLQTNAEKRILEYSHFQRPIYAVKTGEGEPVGIAQYAIHGREWLTALLALKQYAIGVKKGSCWFVPLANPDGALLSEIGLFSAPEAYRETLIATNGGSSDFSLWKANGIGVDLNVNFDAHWGEGVHNLRWAGSENYIGKTPFSEPETQALRDFTLQIHPDYTLSYHTKGEEVYWWFYQGEKEAMRDERLAQILAKATGYTVKKTVGSVGGYKDWCIQTLGIPSFTVEVGEDKWRHPLREEKLEDIYKRNAFSIRLLSEEVGLAFNN